MISFVTDKQFGAAFADFLTLDTDGIAFRILQSIISQNNS